MDRHIWRGHLEVSGRDQNVVMDLHMKEDVRYFLFRNNMIAVSGMTILLTYFFTYKWMVLDKRTYVSRRFCASD